MSRARQKRASTSAATVATASPGRAEGAGSESSDPGPLHGNGWLAIALVSAAVLLYEIGITRILSVVLWYHFAFLAVSLAMLGLGAPGVWYALRGVGPRSLERGLIASAVLAPLSIVVLFTVGGPLESRTAIATICILLPMLAFGSVVCALLIEARGRAIGRMYGADLLGATVGALAVVPLMNVLPTPAIVAGAGLLPAFALAVVGRRRVALALLVAIGALLTWHQPLQLRYSKSYSEKQQPPLLEKWTPTARLTVFSTPFWVPDPKAAFGWGMGKRFVPRPVEQMWLEQDGSAGTPITRLSGPPSALDYLLYDVTSLGYDLHSAATVCIIGAGGGRDILTALSTGAREVDAVELNPHIVDLVSRRFGRFSGDVYHQPGVRAVIDEGRSFLTRTPRRYDLIQISLIDSWAATTAGAFALSENYLYTVEAYRLYWNRLTPTGIISTSRWIRGTNALETIRLGHLVRAALAEEGVADPDRHFAIAQGGNVATVLVSRRPFTGSLLDSLGAACERRGFALHWPNPNAEGDSMSFVGILRQGPRKLLDRGIDLTAPTDDRPFFFHTVTVFGAVDRAAVNLFSWNEKSVLVLRGLMLSVSALALVLFFLPFALGGALPRTAGFWPGSAYFALIGMGFMLVEIPMIQRMILYLGHPSHATTVVLSSMLLGAGLGALASGRSSNTWLRGWAVLLPLVLAGANVAFPGIAAATIGWPWIERAATAFALAGVLGGFMGFALPFGMVRFAEASKAWYWAVNGASGVVASVCSLGLAMTFGFERVMWMGVGLYALAAVVLVRARVSAPPAPPP